MVERTARDAAQKLAADVLVALAALYRLDFIQIQIERTLAVTLSRFLIGTVVSSNRSSLKPDPGNSCRF